MKFQLRSIISSETFVKVSLLFPSSSSPRYLHLTLPPSPPTLTNTTQPQHCEQTTRIRIAIVCIKEIKGGEFLSYDYQFDTEHADKFACACGSKNCRGTMKGGKDLEKQEEEKKKTKAQQLKDAKVKLERDKAYVNKVKESTIKRLDDTGLMVPGAAHGAEEAVLSGPLKKYKEFMIQRRVALWRNAKKGYEGVLLRAHKLHAEGG